MAHTLQPGCRVKVNSRVSTCDHALLGRTGTFRGYAYPHGLARVEFDHDPRAVWLLPPDHLDPLPPPTSPAPPPAEVLQ